MIDKIKQNLLIKHLIIYLGYHLVVVLAYLMIMSIIAFFHFQLNHKLSEIQEWVLGYGWQLVIMSKLIALIIIIHFIEIDNPQGDIYKRLLSFKRIRPDRDVIMITLFTVIFFVVIGRPVSVPHHQFQIIRFMLSIIGLFVFYVTDLIILEALQFLYPLRKTGLKLRLLITPLIFLIMSKTTFMYADGMNIFVLLYFLSLLFLLQLAVNYYFNILFFIVLSSSVLVFCGSDPVWGELFSSVRFKTPLGSLYVLTWLGVFISYLSFKKSKFFIRLRRRFNRLLIA